MLRNLKSFNASEIEEKVLGMWRERRVFDKLQKSRAKKGGKTFRFWEGPPYANGRPGIHHILARVMKDVVLRFKSMQGFYIPRKAGWDTHGLPIEIAAEKALGISTKREIEHIGVEKFNNAAREVIFKYKDEFEKLTERIGFWLDLKNAYATFTPDFVESLWWVFKRANERGHLQEFYRVTPYCPRCETALSSHELGQPGVYQTVSDPSVYIKFPLKGKKNEYLLVWTTTPWTLPANVAVAAKTDVVYTKFKIGSECIWAYRLPEELKVSGEVIETKKGKELAGVAYESLYEHKDLKLPITVHTVLLADFVSTEDGTGFVHIAPTFGEDDFNLVFGEADQRDFTYRVPETVNEEGVMVKGVIGEGLFVKDADPLILNDLETRGLLLYAGKADHEYPHCWRCSSPLLYMALKSWFFRMSQLRKELVAANKGVNWVPDYIKEGRFGEWIAQARDWSISRKRFWGTPLPIWKCTRCSHYEVVGNLEELNVLRAKSNTYFLMRHGLATSNVEGWTATGAESGKFISRLVDAGKKSVEIAAKKLAQEGIDVIISSPFKRTMETAQIIAKHTGSEIITDKRLAEIKVGVFDRKPIMEYEKFFANNADRLTIAPQGGETLRQVRERAYAAFRAIEKKYAGKKILIISHGDTLWMLEAALKHISDEDVFDMKYIKNAEVRPVFYDNFPTDEQGIVDIHRPYVDAVELECKKCSGVMRRIEDVADVWFDSGSMPYGSNHFPFEKKQVASRAPEGFPADFICEGIDQTRGWFYNLMAVSVLLGLGQPFKNVVSLGLIHDKYGQKMSKSKGNVVDPWALINKHGVDAIRWYFYTANSPAEPKNFDEEEVGKIVRRFLLVLYNSLSFLQMYGKNKLSLDAVPVASSVLDRWILARLAEVARVAREHMDVYDIMGAAQELETFVVEDVSRWFIRRSRRRFQKPDNKKDWEAASRVLAYVFLQTSRLLAPFMPFFSEALYQTLKKEFSFTAQDSVHMDRWPSDVSRATGGKLIGGMALVRRIASLVLAKRSEVGIKIRQPLARVTIKQWEVKGKEGRELLAILADEVNVKEITVDGTLSEEFILDTAITPELKAEGMLRELIRAVQGLRQAAGYVPGDSIVVWMDSPDLTAFIKSHEAALRKEVGAARVEIGRGQKFDAELETKLDGMRMWVGVRKN